MEILNLETRLIHFQRTLVMRLEQSIQITKQWVAETSSKKGSVYLEISAPSITMLKIEDNSQIHCQVYLTELLYHQCHLSWKFIKRTRRMAITTHNLNKQQINHNQFSIHKLWLCIHQWLNFNWWSWMGLVQHNMVQFQTNSNRYSLINSVISFLQTKVNSFHTSKQLRNNIKIHLKTWILMRPWLKPIIIRMVQ